MLGGGRVGQNGSVPWWDFPRGPGAVRALVSTSEARGLTRQDCLRGTGIAPADLEDSELVVEGTQELQVMRNLLAAVGDHPGLGAEVGRRAKFSSFGFLGYAFLTSPTLGAGSRLVISFLRLSLFFTSPVVHDTPPRLDIAVDEIPEDVRAFATERDLAALLALYSAVVPSAKLQLDTALSDQRGAALAAVLPGVRIRSGQAADRFSFDSGVWEARLPMAHTETMRSCTEACIELLERRTARRGTAARVRARLLERLDRKPTVGEIAAEFYMEERTLRRHLAAEGTSFTELLDEVHSTLAAKFLGIPSMSIEEIALRLGYADGPAFTHAFKRWTGTTPSAWRAAHQRRG
jgi:AraC-like DNA-binding protein